MSPRELWAIKLASEEILINTITHGYRDNETHEIAFRIRLEDGQLIAEFKDDGIPFDPFIVPSPDTTAALEKRQLGRLGIHLVRSLMDCVEYHRDGVCNRVVLTKRIATSA